MNQIIDVMLFGIGLGVAWLLFKVFDAVSAIILTAVVTPIMYWLSRRRRVSQ